MWVCTNVGFISIVQDKQDANVLKVRARARAHLEALFPGEEILETTNTDYRFRIITDRFTVAQKVFDLIANAGSAPGSVDYPNFKDSVKDYKLHDLYLDFWFLHNRYQTDTQRAVEHANLTKASAFGVAPTPAPKARKRKVA